MAKGRKNIFDGAVESRDTEQAEIVEKIENAKPEAPKVLKYSEKLQTNGAPVTEASINGYFRQLEGEYAGLAESETFRKLQAAYMEAVVRAGVFKEIPSSEKRPTTVILTKKNWFALRHYSVDMEASFSEIVNGWVELHCADYLK